MFSYLFSWLIQNLGFLSLKQPYSRLIQKVLCHLVYFFLWKMDRYEDLQCDILPTWLCLELAQHLLPSLEAVWRTPLLGEFAFSFCSVTTWILIIYLFTKSEDGFVSQGRGKHPNCRFPQNILNNSSFRLSK